MAPAPHAGGRSEHVDDRERRGRGGGGVVDHARLLAQVLAPLVAHGGLPLPAVLSLVAPAPHPRRDPGHGDRHRPREFKGWFKVEGSANVICGTATDPRPIGIEDHGTHMAGLAVANGTDGASGAAPDAALVPVRLMGFCSPRGGGTRRTTRTSPRRSRPPWMRTPTSFPARGWSRPRTRPRRSCSRSRRRRAPAATARAASCSSARRRAPMDTRRRTTTSTRRTPT